MLDGHNVDITNAIKALSRSMWPTQSGLLALTLKLFCCISGHITSHIMFVPSYWEMRTSSPPPLVEKLAGISRESLLRGAVVEEDTDVQDVHQMTQAAYVMCIPLLRVNHTHSS